MTGQADWYLVWCTAEGATDPLSGLQLAMVPKDAPGLSLLTGDTHWTGMRGTWTYGVKLDQIPVARDFVLGGPGAFFSVPLLGPYFHGEAAANFTGIAAGALERAITYVREQRLPPPWLESLAQDPLLRHRTAELYVVMRASLALVAEAARQLERSEAGELPHLDAAMTAWSARCIAHDTAQRVTNDLFQITGTSATLARWDFDRYWRDFTTFSLHDSPDDRLSTIGSHLLDDREYQPSVL
jgi:alkylation response protein AidB-like acyl-CoA dehydrogenase